MKKLTLLAILILATLSASAMKGPWLFHDRHHDNQPPREHHDGDKPSVGAPLDGGLLLAFGAAGVAYYAGRKKKSLK